MTETVQSNSPEKPIRVFVSYAHEDSRWLDPAYRFNLIPFLAESLRKQNIEFWIDRKLVIADEYRKLIESEIDRAQIALLIISQHFLNSQFIESVEMARIQERASRGEMLIAPVLLEPCEWNEYPVLADRHMMPESSPLIDYTDSDARWAKVRFEILDGLKTQIKRIRKLDGTAIPRHSPPESDAIADRHRRDVRTWLGVGGVVAPLVLLAVLAVMHFTKSTVPEGRAPFSAGMPAPGSEPADAPQPGASASQGQPSGECINLGGEWRTSPDLTEMHVTQSGCGINGWFNSSDSAYRHSFSGVLRSTRATIVINRTDPQGCITKMYGALFLDENRLIYTINGTDGGCHLSAQWTETRVWTPVDQ